MAFTSQHRAGKIRVVIGDNTDIVVACQKGRTLAAETGFTGNEQVAIVIAISEVARNILAYAGQGEIVLAEIRREQDGQEGILVISRDQGPGIADIDLALQEGYSTGGGLGIGLPGAKRMMDEFEITSQPGQGTTITMKKWKR